MNLIVMVSLRRAKIVIYLVVSRTQNQETLRFAVFVLLFLKRRRNRQSAEESYIQSVLPEQLRHMRC